MSAEAVYLIEIKKDYAELFSESATGTLDFIALHSGEDAAAHLKAGLNVDFENPQETVLRYRNTFGLPPIYEAELMRPEVRRIGEPGTPESHIAGFLYRYPAFRQAQLRGDFIEVATAIGHSDKLAFYRPLLRHLAERDLFLIFAVYWLSSFDAIKERRLAELFEGKDTNAENDIWAELYDFAKSKIESIDIASFRAEIRTKLSEYLIDRGGSLILPVVGEPFGIASSEIRQRSLAALDEGHRRALIEGLTGTDMRVRAWLESIRFTIQPEPWNKADSDAMSVLATFPEDNRTELAGYIRRDIAAYLAPLARKGAAFEARLYRLDRESLEIQVSVGSE